MGYLTLEDFRGGVDRRRPIYAGKPGTLWECINAHITTGGDVEKRKAFAERGAFSANTYGLFAASELLYTFGSEVSTLVTIPGAVRYMRLQHPLGAPMLRVLDADLFSGLIYVIAEFADSSVMHFYNGTLVRAWSNGLVLASDSSLANVATRLAALINASTNYSATAVGNVITIVAAVNDKAFSCLTLAENGGTVDDEAMVYVQTVAPSPGVSQEGTLTLSGTFDVGDRFGARLVTGTPDVIEYFGNYAQPYGAASCVKTHKRKMYVGARSLLEFSKVNDATAWNVDVDAGAGFMNLSNHVGGSELVLSLESYQGRLAAFSRRAIQLWTMQNDDDLNNLDQVLENTGTRSPRSTLEYAGNDVFYLDDPGIRSIKARDASNNAYASGVGAPINGLVRDWMRNGVSDADIEAAVATVETEEARFWMAIGERIFVYSFFPDTGIAAWSWYEPGFVVSDFARANSRVWARAGDTLYVYGGDSGDEYDTSEVTIALPFTGAQKDGTYKNLNGMAFAATGAWDVQLRIDPNDLNQVVQMGENEGFTYSDPAWAAVGHCTHISPLLTNSSSGYASLSKLSIFYEGVEAMFG